jgi:uncharacterized protein YukE
VSFKVDPQAIRAYAHQMKEAANVAGIAAGYVRRHDNVSAHGTGLLAQAMGSHAELVSALDQMLDHLNRLTDTSETALKQTVAQYEHTDRDSAARIDACYPEVTRPAPATD